jgi:hypothetical protein
VNELARILARALALDVKQWPDGPPADVSVISGPRSSRSGKDTTISGHLHPDPRAFDCSPTLRVIGGAA